ncbi:S9 family peptidase [Agaribacter flavus]|uniref:Prolyl oligopeptidase family serine peptidase n=1 Tax=Agaribacter flavus TaxID=1902781 RepID=A0ABV7FLW3_9ALTE
MNHNKISKLLSSFTITLLLCACAGSQSNSSTETEQAPNKAQAVSHVQSVVSSQSSYPKDGELSLEQIMADPDWIGRQPKNPSFSPLTQQFTYTRKRLGSVVEDLYITDVAQGNGKKVALSSLHEHSFDEYIDDKDMSFVAWVFEGNIFAKFRDTQSVIQLTRDAYPIANIAYMGSESVSFQVGNSFYAVNAVTGFLHQMIRWSFEDKPVVLAPAKDYIMQEQLRLIQYENVQRKNRRDRLAYEKSLWTENRTILPPPVYLDKKHETVLASMSPDGNWVVLATREATSTRADTDIMPDYIEEDGRIATKSVRRRVADAKPESHYLYLINVNSGEKNEISYVSLPGYNDDVLADVKRENAKKVGKDYVDNRLPRDIGLLFDWYATETPIKWHDSSKQVALMLEAWDNKDRWIVTLNPASNKLTTQHRMHDKAWINYRYNQFGWFEDSLNLYLLSESSGYSQLYIKPIDGDLTQLTKGQYVVDDVYLDKNDTYFYYKANKKHPGIYEIYRTHAVTGETQALTNLNGMSDFEISPDESTMLLTHSKLTMPPELYSLVLDKDKIAEPMKLTSTVSKAFLSIDWVTPSIITIPSSHVNEPIYARLYTPENLAAEKRRAVVFNHGAGYLQNAHMGWSNYFREFMFHSLLVSKGYVVLDMDYRASAGYGREWRTAIYRHMGKPEIEDNVDGVNWLVEHANVDRQRIGTYGGSYGGFLTFMALFTEPELYQAGAALRPVSDWAHYNFPYTSNILNTPSVDPIAYERSSPIYFAEGLRKPLLINAPMVDDNVFFVDVVRLVQRLIELEKQNFETAIYPVEPHGFVQPSSWLDEYRRIFKLFEENL